MAGPRRVSLPPEPRTSRSVYDSEESPAVSGDMYSNRRSDSQSRRISPPRGILRPPRSVPPDAPVSSTDSSPKRSSLQHHPSFHPRDRYASLPVQFSAWDRPGSVDIEDERQARACGQTSFNYPRYDSTQQPLDNGRIRAMSDSISPPAFIMPDFQGTRQVDPRSVDVSPAAPPPQLKPPTVRNILQGLDVVLKAQKKSMRSVLDLHAIVAMLEPEDTEEGENLSESKDNEKRVFGVPLAQTVAYASTPAVVGGYSQRLPTVVYASIEELFKTGIYQPHLFRALPSRTRHLQLISVYDQPPTFGSGFNLRAERMEDLCALLMTYLCSLPEPVMVKDIGVGFWAWCVKPWVEDEKERIANEDRVDKSNSRYRDESKERTEIVIAQSLLRLLPLPNFSLLVYLLAFFTQIPLSPDNGMLEEDVARVFGWKVLGGANLGRRSKETSDGSGKGLKRERETEEDKWRGEMMMLWLMQRWGKISEGLFDFEGYGMEDDHTRAEGRGRRRGSKRAEKRNSVSSRMSPKVAYPDDESELITPTPSRSCTTYDVSGVVSATRSSTSSSPGPRANDGSLIEKDLDSEDEVISDASDSVFDSDRMNLYRANSVSVYSTLSAEEHEFPESITAIASLNQLISDKDKIIDSCNRELERAQNRIRELESNARSTTDIDATKEKHEEGIDSDGLDWYDLLLWKDKDDEELKLRLEDALRERDEGRKIIEAIKKLLS